MVYCGKPSKACEPCRVKRTRCDLQHPSCGQCIRAGRECHGYRELQPFMFRNETKESYQTEPPGDGVILEMRTSSLPSRSATSTPMSSIPSRSTTRTPMSSHSSPSTTATPISTPQWPSKNALILSKHAPQIPPHLSEPLTDQAVNFFFYHYVSQDAAYGTGYLKFLPAIYRQTSPTTTNAELIEAVGLAGIGYSRHSNSLVLAARSKQTNALRMIAKILADPELARTDEALLAVLILGLFETYTCTNPHGLKSWSSHVNGATALVQLRGQDQIRTDIGRRMFNHIRMQVVIDCLQRRRSVPPSVLATLRHAQTVTCDIPLFELAEQRLFHIIARLCALREVVKNGTTDADAMVLLSCSLDADFHSWSCNLPHDFTYVPVEGGTTDTFLKYQHIYDSSWIVSIWNIYRCARILANEITITFLPYLTPSSEDFTRSAFLCARAFSTNSELAMDICASIDFNLEGSAEAPRAAAGIAMIWPLYMVAARMNPTPGANAWVVGRLERMRETMGIQLAAALAGVLRSQGEITVWERMDGEVVEDGEW